MIEAEVLDKHVNENVLELSESYHEIKDEKRELEILASNYRKSFSKYKETIAVTDRKLTDLQCLTEDVFLKIGNKLPDINNELSESESEAKRLLQYFEQESGFLTDSTSENSSDMARLNSASTYLLDTVEKQGEAFQQMSCMMARIENIKQSIVSVRTFSLEMETLSINAAIVAIKAGSDGRTLNPITEILNKMANSAITLIDEITKTSELLTEKYNSFQALSDKQATLCKTNVVGASDRVSSKYKNLQGSILDLSDWLNKIIEALSGSKDPICNIMNGLQVQDIVKQCADHVRMSLEKAGTENISTTNPDRFFDAIHFQEKVPLLCVQLLDDIDARLAESIENLSVELSSIDNLSMEVVTSSAFETTVGNDKSNLLEDIDNSFDGVKTVALDMANMMREMVSSWEELWSTTVALEELLKTLEEQFIKLKKLTNFHLINIPIKIEVARNSGLEKDSDLSARVEGLADFITTEMKKSQKTIVADYQFLNQMVKEIGKRKNGIVVNLDLVAADVEAMLGNFIKAKQEVEVTFAFVHDRMIELSKLVRGSLDDLERIRELIKQNNEIKSDLRQLAEMARYTKENIMAGIERSDWEIKDSRLKDIVDKFTVLEQKKIAESICDFDIEDGNMEGDLILF